MRSPIEKLRKALPELLTLQQYCDATNRSPASAYNDLRRKPGLGVKIGRYTRFVRDFMLDEMAQPPQPWMPFKDRNHPPAKAKALPDKRRRDEEVRL